MRPNAAIALALLAGLGAAGGVADPIGESRRAFVDDFPVARRTRFKSAPKNYDRKAERKKGKQARKARNKNKR